MKRTPLKRKTQLAPVSQARQRENTQRAKNLETEFGPRSNWRCILRDNPKALAALGPCYGGVNGHEIVKASQGGSRTDVANIVLLCNFHNGEVENQPVIARSLGLVRSSWERSSDD